MDDLINFDEKTFSSDDILTPVLLPEVLHSTEAFLAPKRETATKDPFDPFEFSANSSKIHEMSGLTDGSQFSFDFFSTASVIDSTPPESTISIGSAKTIVSRSHSDTSTISAAQPRPPAKANRSVDDIQNRQNQLLKLSLFNSANCSSNGNASITESVLIEARMISSRRFSDYRDLSFEDLNNVTQPIDSSMNDTDLQDMKIQIISDGTLPQYSHSADKIAMLNKKLTRIKQEVAPVIKEEVLTPEKLEEASTESAGASSESAVASSESAGALSESAEGLSESAGSSPEIEKVVQAPPESKPDLDSMLKNLKSQINDGNKAEARKQLERLNQLLGRQNEVNTSHVKPRVIEREATFEIDRSTGEKKEAEDGANKKTENDDLIEKLTKLLGNQVGIHSLNLGADDVLGGKLLVVLPAAIANPVTPKLAHAVQRTQSAVKSKDAATTPLKRLAHAPRSNAYTTPRLSTRAAHPYEQKLSNTGAVRKSLMTAIDSPQKNPIAKTRSSTAAPRRSVSLKERMIPAVQVHKASPMKAAPKLSTGAPYNLTASRRLSQAPARPSTVSKTVPPPRPRTQAEQKKTISQFKAPSVVRKQASASHDKGSLV